MNKQAHLLSFERQVRRTIRRVERGEVCLPADGETYVCSICEAREKPCACNPDYQCPDKILGATQLKSLLELSRRERNGSPAVCLLCGRTLLTRELSRDPLRELCSSCRKRKVRSKRRE